MQTLEAQQECFTLSEKIITSSEQMLRVLDQANRAAEVDATVLITGESGTGKELIAETIHSNSPRHDGPYLIVNMAAVPENLIESELFGHVSGAFTGAAEKRIGRFEAAHGGTLFIDEIGDLALECQAKMLRILENHQVTPVGSNEYKNPDVRVIAATNRSLERMIQEGTFREELYYRLNVVAIALPPLRERPEDIELLVDRFLDELAATYDRIPPTPNDELLEFLRSYHWPGNIRQLRNCVESMFVLTDAPVLTMDDLPPMIQKKALGDPVHFDLPENVTLDQVVKAAVRQKLDRYDGNRTSAAKSLGISVRTLQRWLKNWGNGEVH